MTTNCSECGIDSDKEYSGGSYCDRSKMRMTTDRKFYVADDDDYHYLIVCLTDEEAEAYEQPIRETDESEVVSAMFAAKPLSLAAIEELKLRGIINL